MSRLRKRVKEVAEEVEAHASSEAETTPFIYTPSDSDIFISTGSTLLDLAISGGRVRGGGIPGGVMVELFGGPGAGKTALLMELAASAQLGGGTAVIADPEARLDQEYARVYGASIDSDKYFRPDTVLDEKNDRGKVVVPGLESIIKEWNPENTDVVNLLGADSIAALSTTMEMGAGDKRGQRKAKELHALCRMTARKIAHDNRLVVFTNQLTSGDWGDDSPGGVAIKFYASLRIQIKQKKKIVKKRKNKAGKEITKTIGIESECFIRKSSIDDPFRTCPIYLIFGYGLDDIRANLQYVKDMTKASKYECPDGKGFVSMDKAISHIENYELEGDLREVVIDLWEENEALFQEDRQTKRRIPRNVEERRSDSES